MKKILCSVVAAFVMAGCSSGSNTDTTSDTSTDITVERGPVIGSYVVDADAKRAINIGNGQYRFTTSPTYPITAYGGYIDVNRDGVIDGNDTALSIPLSLKEENKNKLTILTTLANSSDQLKYVLLDRFGLTEDELYSLTPATSLTVLAISNSVFKYCIENDIAINDINTTVLDQLKSEIETIISDNENSESSILDIAIQTESDLVADLNITLSQTDVNLTVVTDTIEQSSEMVKDPTAMLDSMPLYQLTSEQKEGLVFMYQEEKVARDVYTKLYEKWGNRVFLNISKAEQTHMDSVRAILEKYELEVPVLSDIVGEFDLEKLKELYDNLIATGEVSSNDAMKVGVLVEKTDIADLIERMADAPEDITVVYQSLLNGSYNHLNAFSKQVY